MDLVIPKILKQASCESIDKAMPPEQTQYFNNRFKSTSYPKKDIKFMTYHGDPGMAPMTHRGVQAPTFKGGGVSEVSMQGALINEKIMYSEEEVNDVLNAGDPVLRQAAEMVLLQKVEDLSTRNDLRKDWLGSQLFFNDGVISYIGEDGTKIYIDYKIPDANKTALTSSLIWGTGADREVAQDCADIKKQVRRCGGPVSKVFINSDTLNSKLRDDTAIQAWVAKSAHPMKANIFTNPLAVMREFLDIPLEINDDYTTLSLILTGQADSTHISVNDATGLTAGTDFWVVRVNGDREEYEEKGTIDSISGNTITVTSAMSGTFTPNADIVMAEVPYLADNKLVFVAEKVKGKDIMDWKDAPLGFKSQFGKQFKTWGVEDPDNILTRCQRLGIWALKYPGAIASITV